MKDAPRLPLAPLLRAYAEATANQDPCALPIWGLRLQAIAAARANLVHGPFLETASEADFQLALVHFYEVVVHPALHTVALQRQLGLIRFALGHLVRGRDPLPVKMDRLLTPAGDYHIAGLGPSFWSALCQALDPMRNPSWLPPILAGLRG